MRRCFFVVLSFTVSILSAQSSSPALRLTVIDIDGTIHIVRSADGPYASFAEIPSSLRKRIDQQRIRANGVRTSRSGQSVHFVVSDNSDADDSDLEDGLYSPPTLRSAIQNANLLGGSHVISFASGLTKISPSIQLPGISVPITINGTVAAGKIIIDGFLSSGSIGISLGNQSTVTNVRFEWWKAAGLALGFGANNSTLQYNEFAFNKTGLNINADSSLVGGDSLSTANKAVLNTQEGIAVVFGDKNRIRYNYSGTMNGITAAGNSDAGVYVSGEQNSVVGNILSGNDDAGLELGEFANRTLVKNNYIGVNVFGSTRLPNHGDGITTFADRDSIVDNVIAANGDGITVLGQASHTYIGFNNIGINASEDSLIGNRDNGIQLLGANAVVESNIISANNGDGISVTGLGGAVIRRNYIGTNRNGTADWGNNNNGIYISCNGNMIGGNSIADANVISGNGSSGIELYGGIIFSFPGPSGPNYVLRNTIQFNSIGTNKAGTAKIPNADGITLWGYADSNIVYSNLVSGNSRYGIRFRPANGVPSYNNISGNYIGTNYTGFAKLSNTSAGVHVQAGYKNMIGGPTNAYANIISGNDGPGVLMEGGAANIVSHNSIGVNLNGGAALGNNEAGVKIAGWSDENEINSNHLSGNKGAGIVLTSRNGYLPFHNVIIGNVIGLNFAMNAPLPNTGEGIFLYNAENTWIGGTTFDSSNVISGNSGPGIQIEGDSAWDNSVWGNYIGTNQEGTAAIPNERGIVLYQTRWNKIGGSLVGSGNLISGNLGEGIYLYGADSNSIAANIIGLNLDQTAALPNNYAGIVIDSSRGNFIGSDPAGIGNTVSGNLLSGIVIKNRSHDNRIFNNAIGTNYTGTAQLGNKQDGIQIYGGSSGNIIGSLITTNKIRYNTLAGIIVADSARNKISANSFEGNGELGIDLLENGQFGVTPNDDGDGDIGANGLQNFPELYFADGPSPVRVTGKLRSTPNMSFRIELFEADATDGTKYGEGKRYLGSQMVTTDVSGIALINTTLPVSVTPGNFITATATDSNGNTSEFSRCVTVISTGIFADVDVSVSANRDTVKLGDTLLYHIRLTNIGPDSATSVVLRDTLSRRVSLLADSVSKGEKSFANRVFTLNVAALSAGESVNIYLAVRTDSAGLVVHSASAAAAQSDFHLFNNIGRDTVVVSSLVTVRRTETVPASFALYQNFPNPFNPATTITFDIPAAAHVELTVFDPLGRVIATVVNEEKEAGRYSVLWNGGTMASGVYFYRIRSGEFTATKKLMLLK